MAAAATAKLQEQFDAGLTTRPDFTIDQPLERYGAVDHAVWEQLYRRQMALLEGRACEAFIEGAQRIGLNVAHVPIFDAVSERLMAATGWRIVAVPGLVPERIFFEHLAHRRFPVTWWMRRPDQLDYLQEPDCFHDLFGHVPLLTDPVFADAIHAYGRAALAVDECALPLLARLYWYTVEFGLIRDTSGEASAPQGVKIYGAGIVSSKGESLYSVESAAPNRLAFDLERVLRTRYRIDTFQKTYFVIDSFAQLFDALGAGIAARLAHPAPLIAAAPYAAGDVLHSDTIYTRGTREGWLDDGDV
ncbi:Phenylalanine-4-hydroxylase [Paraburkholderia caffeinitolerans]|uniref:Phenylalanine-4-hydroxylase n=1 Tax=Paraburkholderia caffeinitolerans TaxID=1723730 RepID=A0A6J5FI46_9BURK|nr:MULTISPECIES: phenylalanine 4-monooxygenase [Paraburkholderia]CAB3780835.1 Phenylalanine-4-hydroxylase [Paraburkholderia caffeinitolerans]